MEISTGLPFDDVVHNINMPVLVNDHNNDSSDDNIIRGPVTKQNSLQPSDSEGDLDKENLNRSIASGAINNRKKRRIKKISESESDSSRSPTEATTIPQMKSSRIENRRKKLIHKFKKLVTSPTKESVNDLKNEKQNHESENVNSIMSDNDLPCLEPKKKFKKKKITLSSICDPDSSDEDNDSQLHDEVRRQKLKHNSLKPSEHKKPRMSAKQAEENMQKIKSESNRMLRERDISLPYHKPKALSLQDIMNRRKPTLDGKAMPIKMNNEQLQQYAKLLEERQKEMIELCKSESDEDPLIEKEEQSRLTRDEELTENDNLNGNGDGDIAGEGSNKAIVEINKKCETLEESGAVINETSVNININGIINPALSKDDTRTTNSLLESSNQIDSDPESHPTILNLDSEKSKICTNDTSEDINKNDNHINHQTMMTDCAKRGELDDDFIDEDEDINLEDINKMIENAEILKDNYKCDTSVMHTLEPKLTGSPGTFIDLGTGIEVPKKLTGVELLKERFEYFSKLKSLEDSENTSEKKHKPGTQHLKLKHELEEIIAEQRCTEWEKRLENDKKLKADIHHESDDGIEKLEAKLEENDQISSSSSEEEDDLVENDIEMIDKPRKNNPMLDDEAEESDVDAGETEKCKLKDDNGLGEDEMKEVEDDANSGNEDDSSDETSSGSEEEESMKPKKGRILKAFEDSDDESNHNEDEIPTNVISDKTEKQNQVEIDAQDDDIQLAQMNNSTSEDIFASQGTHKTDCTASDVNGGYTLPCTPDLGSQTFSILNSETVSKEDISIVSSTQSIDETKFDTIGKRCSESLTQNLLSSPTLVSQSQEIGDDIAAMCTGKFYDNPFVSQDDGKTQSQSERDKDIPVDEQETCTQLDKNSTKTLEDVVSIHNLLEHKTIDNAVTEDKQKKTLDDKPPEDCNILKSILDELNEPETETRNKYFSSTEKNENLVKKRLIIDSDDENETLNVRKRIKLKKRKPEKRALQISDDEEESEIELEESDIEEDTEKIVEYDSEENEIEVKAKPLKKKRMGEFFENEAELTSEDEWIGSGDEDEGGLDRMEREEGDSDVFQQDQLQRQLGQIHMREVLDQDKREVRLLQELMFEDGDLGDGHRQRKFRWNTDADGEEDGVNPVDLTDTQEEDFESEEQWRKQRHEREMFLRSMQENDEEKVVNTSINRTAIIKASLSSRTISSLTAAKPTESVKAAPTNSEAKSTKDIPSPKKSFLILKQSYHGSMLSRGRGALARLAALATPLAAESDAPRPVVTNAAGNFVFTALTPKDKKPKVTKRKAEASVGTPRLLKKMKTDDVRKRNSLLDHFKT